MYMYIVHVYRIENFVQSWNRPCASAHFAPSFRVCVCVFYNNFALTIRLRLYVTMHIPHCYGTIGLQLAVQASGVRCMLN